MSIKRNNWFLLIFAVGFTVLSSMFSSLTRWNLYSVIPYLLLFGLGLLLIKKDKDETVTFKSVLPYHVGIKPLTALITVALVFLLMPLATLLAELGSLLGGDIVSLFNQVQSTRQASFIEQLFGTALVPAVFEEMFFRGFFYQGFKKARGARTAIILTAILFGVFHMNVQQTLYAIALGIVIAVLREATGSMWTGMLFHFVNNGFSVVCTCVKEGSALEAILLKLPSVNVHYIGEAHSYNTDLGFSIAVLIVFTALAIFLLRVLCKKEGCLQDAKRLFKRDTDPHDRLVTAPLVLTFIYYGFAVLIMSLVMKVAPAMMNGSFLSQYQ